MVDEFASKLIKRKNKRIELLEQENGDMAEKHAEKDIAINNLLQENKRLEAFIETLQNVHFFELQREKATVERYEKVLKQIATPGTGKGYWEAKKALEDNV